jgi:Spy/CpxP family protein refolding chaperone
VARRTRARKGLLVGLGLMLVTGAASFSVAQAQGPGGGGGPAAHAGPFGGFFAFRMHRVLDRVGATDGQKAQIKAIWDGLRPQLKGLRQQQQQLRQQIGQAMTAPTIDPAQVEKLRQQSVQLMDKTSQVFTQGMVSTAQVLTPDQRKQVLVELQKHHRHPGADAGAGAGE